MVGVQSAKKRGGGRRAQLLYFVYNDHHILIASMIGANLGYIVHQMFQIFLR